MENGSRGWVRTPHTPAQAGSRPGDALAPGAGAGRRRRHQHRGATGVRTGRIRPALTCPRAPLSLGAGCVLNYFYLFIFFNYF